MFSTTTLLPNFSITSSSVNLIVRRQVEEFRVGVNKLVGKCSYVVLINYLQQEALVLFCPEGMILIKDCWHSVTFPAWGLYSFP